MSLHSFKVGPDVRMSSAIHTLRSYPQIDIAPISTYDSVVKDEKAALDNRGGFEVMIRVFLTNDGMARKLGD